MNMSKNSKTIKCPRCKTLTEYSADNVFRPFCSEKCKIIDLGAWASEEHRIAGTEKIDANSNDDTKEFDEY